MVVEERLRKAESQCRSTSSESQIRGRLQDVEICSRRRPRQVYAARFIAAFMRSPSTCYGAKLDGCIRIGMKKKLVASGRPAICWFAFMQWFAHFPPMPVMTMGAEG